MTFQLSHIGLEGWQGWKWVVLGLCLSFTGWYWCALLGSGEWGKDLNIIFMIYMIEMIPKTNFLEAKCKDCGGTEFILRNDELVCIRCGQVIQKQRVEDGPEWRTFGGLDMSRSRVGMPPTLMMHDKGLSTVIGKENEDYAGKRIAGGAKRDIDRLRKWQQRIMSRDSKERNLSIAIGELNMMGEKLKLPSSVLEKASYIYRTALDRGLVRGRSIRYLVAASLYVAIRQEGLPRTIKEISKVAGLDKREVARNFRLVIKKLKVDMPIIDPAIHVKRICIAANLNKRVMVEATKILRLAQERRLTSGVDPVGVAAATVYYACYLLGVEKTHMEIAQAAGVSQVTVRNKFKLLSNAMKLKETLVFDDLVKI
jgi:transcription initiation factor TFIIB